MTMIKPILFAAALLAACATASPLTKRDNDNGNDAIPCFNATIRKEYLLWVNTFQPYDPYKSENKIRVNIADPTNENRDAIVCTDASWNSTKVPFPSDYLTCSDPTISYKVTSYTNHSTFSLVFNQTFVQDVFSETILASYDATKKSLNGGSCYADSGCGSWPQSGGQGHAIVYDVQKNGPPSTTFPSQCAPAPLPTRSDLPIRYTSEGAKDPADTSSSVSSYISFDILTNPNNGWRVKCAGPTWDSATQAAQPADWYPCPNIEYIPGNWSFRVESYTDYQTFDLGIKQHICNEVQCQDNLAYANLTAATGDPRYNSCDGQNKCTASSAFNTVNAPIYAVVNQTVVS